MSRTMPINLLLERAQSMKSTVDEYPGSIFDPASFRAFRIAAEHALTEEFGEDHRFTLEFKKQVMGSDADSLAFAVELLSYATNSAEHATRSRRNSKVNKGRTISAPTGDTPSFFPISILEDTKRQYLVTIGRQMNGCFEQGWFDASAVMMRRLLEIVLIEAFEASKASPLIKDANGNYLQLSALVSVALSDATLSLSRNAKKHLPRLREVGHNSAHGRFFTAKKDDLEALRDACRVTIEEMLHHAKLI